MNAKETQKWFELTRRLIGQTLKSETVWTQPHSLQRPHSVQDVDHYFETHYGGRRIGVYTLERSEPAALVDVLGIATAHGSRRNPRALVGRGLSVFEGGEPIGEVTSGEVPALFDLFDAVHTKAEANRRKLEEFFDFALKVS